MALPGVRHGSERNPLGWNIASRSKSQSPQMTDSSQSHDGLLTEPPPRRTSLKAMTDSWYSYDQGSYF